MVLFWGWYALSINDLNFGTIFLSRELNILVFRLYGEILGVAPAEVRDMLVRACVVDSLLVLAIAAWRLRRRWLPQLSGIISARLAAWGVIGQGSVQVEPVPSIVEPDGPVHPAE